MVWIDLYSLHSNFPLFLFNFFHGIVLIKVLYTGVKDSLLRRYQLTWKRRSVILCNSSTDSLLQSLYLTLCVLCLCHLLLLFGQHVSSALCCTWYCPSPHLYYGFERNMGCTKLPFTQKKKTHLKKLPQYCGQ